MAQWIKDQGLERPIDLKYAFRDKAEALQVGGEEVAALWRSLPALEENIPSSWAVVRMAAGRRRTAEPTKEAPSSSTTCWNGLKKRKAQSRKEPNKEEESQRKVEAGKVASIIQGWGLVSPIAKEASEYEGQEEKDEAWRRLICRISSFEAASIAARIRTWRNWESWAIKKNVPVHGGPSGEVQKFLMHERVKGQCNETAPRIRWDHLKWWVSHAGAGIDLPEYIKPRRKMTQGGVRDGQALAADPEVHLQIEQVIMAMDPSDPHMCRDPC